MQSIALLQLLQIDFLSTNLTNIDRCVLYEYRLAILSWRKMNSGSVSNMKCNLQEQRDFAIHFLSASQIISELCFQFVLYILSSFANCVKHVCSFDVMYHEIKTSSL